MQNSKQLTQQKQGMVADGFSSEEELYTKKGIEVQEKSKIDQKEQAKQRVKYVLPPPQQIKSKAYSLLPDKVTGWGIKAEQPNPIPIIFRNKYMDELINIMLASQSKNYPVVYLGPRYENTFYAWRDKPFKFPYSHINMPKQIKYKKRPFLGQNPEVAETIYFDSIFESGNLDVAIKVNNHEYDLFIRVDSNTRGHFNWFNFVVAGLKGKQKYKFNICNLEKGFCLYTRGMKPYMKFLRKKNDLWRQNGQNSSYSRKEIRFAKLFGFEPLKLWTLTFEIEAQEDGEQIQIAYCIPYTYSHLLKTILEFREQNERKNIIKESSLCTSLGGLPIPLLTVTEPQRQEQKPKNKKCIVICGRVHPGQSNGSFMMEGFLKFICGDSRQAKYLRKHIMFKIVPMLNPDGVILGNYRTGLSGRDFNRQYNNPDKDIFPEVYFFKKLVTEKKIIFKNGLFMFLDFHGHSTKKNVFAYGPEFPMSDKYYYQSRIFTKMLEKQNKMFRYHSCVFRVSECKLATARAILLRKINIPLTFTIEASNGFYHDKELLASLPFFAEQWVRMGISIGHAIYEYVECMILTQKIKQDREKAKNEFIKNKREKSKSLKPAEMTPIKKENLKSILLAQEQAKIKKIYEQILKQQNQADEAPNSDDEISEGSSDKEDDKDNLSKKQLQTLFSSIKNNNKLGKNKIKKGIRESLDLKIEENEQEENITQPKIEHYKSKYRFKLAQTFDKPIQSVEIGGQVFIADRTPLINRKEMKAFNQSKYFNDRHQKGSNSLVQTQNSTKIINCKFEEERSKTDCLETISIFPSFALKNKNTISISQKSEIGMLIKNSHRSIMISNAESSPRSIRLVKGKDFNKKISMMGYQQKNELDIKLQQIGRQRFGINYLKLTSTGFYQRKDVKNNSIPVSKRSEKRPSVFH